jgi:hypothetical protein
MVRLAPQAAAVMMKINAATKTQLLEIDFNHTPTVGICIQCNMPN